MPLNWDLSSLADAMDLAIQSIEAELQLEQAVYGLDARSELQLQALLAAQLSKSYEVAREVHYPSSFGAKLTHRRRCDMVLSPRGRPLKLDRAPATLFDAPDLCPPENALWLEVKVAYQFREGGVRHAGYGQQWRGAVVSDLVKMEGESAIHEAALVLIVFNESKDVLEKDLGLFEDVLMRKEVLAGFRHVRSVGIWERMGHRWCSVAVWPTIQR